MRFEPLIVWPNGLPGKSFRIDMILVLDAKAWNGLTNLAVWLGSLRVTNMWQVNQKLYLLTEVTNRYNFSWLLWDQPHNLERGFSTNLILFH